MLDLIRELFQYQSWADLQIVEAARPFGADAELRKTLHHIIVVQRFFLLECSGREFDTGMEMRPPDTFEELEQLFRDTHAEALEFVAGLDPARLNEVLDRPPLDKMKPKVREALVQTVLHTQHHRGQVATRLRTLGATPPTVDYILMPKVAR
jgi:uncharacterized damage-inducible protein DinB